MDPRGALALLGVSALVLATTAAKPVEAEPVPVSVSVPVPVSVSVSVPVPVPVSVAEPASASCPSGSVLVSGVACDEVDQRCLAWAPQEPTGTRMRCLRFAEARCTGKRARMRFCIDEYEFPNRKGELPIVDVTYERAAALCAARGERLCKGAEWTLACEGEQRLPYPYGLARDDRACNVDQPLSGPSPNVLAHPPRGMVVSLVDWRVPSGSMERCASPFGVRDMTGNVDEWVINEKGKPFASGLKGGYWGPVRDRCCPMTIAHDERFSFYQIGFRCCADAMD